MSKKKGFASEVAAVTPKTGYTLQTEGEQIVRKALNEGKTPKNIPNDDKKKQSSSEGETKVDLSTLEQIASQAAEIAAKNAIASLTEVHEKEKVELQSQLEEAQTKATVAEQTAKEAIELASKEAENKIAEIEQQKQDAIAQAQAEKEQAVKDKQTLEGVFKLTGSKMPNFNADTNPLQDEPVGRVAEIKTIYDRLPSYSIRHHQSKAVAEQRNFKLIRGFIADHFRECKAKGLPWQSSSLIKDLEVSMRNHGYLGGKVTRAAGATIGTPESVGAFFLDVLANIMRETHNQHNIWWQFPMTAFNAATAPSLTMGVPRYNFLPQPQNIADFELATSSTFEAVTGAIGTTTDSQSLEATTVPITVTEYGLGKGGIATAAPVFIPEFHEQISLISLMSALDTRLMQHYYAFEELLIRSQFETATVTLYSNNGGVVFAPGDVVSGGGGTFTEALANSIYTEMYANQMPSFPDGCYALVLNPYAAGQYKASLGDQYRPVTEAQKMAVSNTFSVATGVEIGHVNGYIGKYNNFHVFEGNSWGVGNAGTVPTVNNETLGGVAVDVVDSFAFAPGCIGRGIALGAEIRASGVNPYQRGESYIWLSREGVAPMDLDVALNPNQQTRCYKIRTSKVAV